MRLCAILLAVAVMQAQAPATAPAAAPKAKPVGTMKELMLDYIFPTSNEIFYVSRNEEKSIKDWNDLRSNALMMAEAANILMSPERAYDKEQWMEDAKLLWVVGDKAYKAAQKKDLPALEALNDELYEACQSCHVHYRPGYKRRP
jgi:cytochrome c556